ncbi:lasso peptide biosynthesis B2 protein [Streptomyces sp. NPDC092296]|uniref:lasso peptide biosynthesis B2 protein n=1 Tax=Streptomyces sp. NPDC092296 TaxID=3366012 RepID=UPI0038165693
MSFTVALPPRSRISRRQWLLGRAAGFLAQAAATRRPNPDARVARVATWAVGGARRPSTAAEAEQAVRAVTTAHPALGGATACLDRAVAALLYCRAHGHAPALVVGVRPGTAQVHAWIEAEGVPAAEPADPRLGHTPVIVHRPGVPT